MLLAEVVLTTETMSSQELKDCLGNCCYRWVHMILLSHQKVWHLYDEVYRKTQHGKHGRNDARRDR